jgi:hypothetical protein
MTFQVKRWHSDEGNRVALVKTNGPKWLHVLALDLPLVVRKVPTTEAKNMHELTFKDKPYPLRKAVKAFRQFGKKTGGFSKTTKRFLTDASLSW